jgi:glutamate--cysteine ligase|tara:strand:+ start:832 stop:1068 length:237 start_codon:yes stop_codon:yes gene_type:complete
MVTNIEHIINYFKSGIRDTKDFKIGIEHEKFLFNQNENKRADYKTILKMFDALSEFGWKPIMEKKILLVYKKKGKILH